MNALKSQVIIFPFNKSPKRKPKSKIKFEGNEIEFTKTATYLGIVMDSKRTFASHISKTCEKANNSVKSLYPLLAHNSRLSDSNKNIIFKSIIRPIMTYGSPIWHQSARCHINKLQVVQNKCLKLINRLPWWHSTDRLHKETKYPRITDYMQTLADNFSNKCANSSFELIRELATD